MTRGYKGSHEVTGGCKGLEGVTRGCRGVTRGCRGVTRGDKLLQRVRWGYRG